MSTRVRLQVEWASVGSVEIITLPFWSTATHSDAEAQDTPLRTLGSSTAVIAHVRTAAVGSVEAMTSPLALDATHRDAEGQDTPLNEFSPSTLVVQVGVAPVGSAELTAFPLWSTATHRDGGGQDTPLMRCLGQLALPTSSDLEQKSGFRPTGQGARLHGTLGEPLIDPDYFRQVRVDEESRTIVWPNGLDPAPGLLHGDYEPASTSAADAQQAAA